MKEYKTILNIILTLLITTSSGITQKLTLIARTTKSVYLVGEPVWLKIILKNNSNITIKAPEHLWLASGIDLSLLNSDSTRLDYKGIVSHSNSYEILIKGDSTVKYFDLLNSYGEKEPLFSPRCSLNPGDYYLTATYDNFGIPIQSNKIMFTIRRPSGDQAKALKLFKEAYNNWLLKKDYDKAVELYKRLINTYPNSVYVELAYNEICLWNRLQLRNYSEVISFAEELLNKHPQSPYLKRMIYNIAIAYKKLDKLDQLDAKLWYLEKKYGSINPTMKEKIEEVIESIRN